jgi:hypothetical protein
MDGGAPRAWRPAAACGLLAAQPHQTGLQLFLPPWERKALGQQRHVRWSGLQLQRRCDVQVAGSGGDARQQNAARSWPYFWGREQTAGRARTALPAATAHLPLVTPVPGASQAYNVLLSTTLGFVGSCLEGSLLL